METWWANCLRVSGVVSGVAEGEEEEEEEGRREKDVAGWRRDWMIRGMMVGSSASSTGRGMWRRRLAIATR